MTTEKCDTISRGDLIWRKGGWLQPLDSASRPCNKTAKDAAVAAGMDWWPDLYSAYSAAMSGAGWMLRLRCTRTDRLLPERPRKSNMLEWNRAILTYTYGSLRLAPDEAVNDLADL